MCGALYQLFMRAPSVIPRKTECVRIPSSSRGHFQEHPRCRVPIYLKDRQTAVFVFLIQGNALEKTVDNS